MIRSQAIRSRAIRSRAIEELSRVRGADYAAMQAASVLMETGEKHATSISSPQILFQFSDGEKQSTEELS